MAELTSKTLRDNGWKSRGWCANREFFKKGPFEIVEHNGNFMLRKDDCFYGDISFNSLEEVNSYCKRALAKRGDALLKELKKITEDAKSFE